jgi:hypothetical protein
MKTLIIENCDWSREIIVDDTIFKNYHIEGCTIAIEQNIKSGNLKVSPFINSHIKSSKCIHTFNTYFILINAGYHLYAENLRVGFKTQTCIDLKYEPIRG